MTDDLKEQLLPCPYCAGEAHIYTTSQDSDTSVTAQCKECGAEMNFWLPWTAGDGQKAQAWQDVMNRWNTRAPDPRITDLEAKLQRLGRELNLAKYGEPDFAWEIHKNAVAELEARLAAAEAGEDALAEALRSYRADLCEGFCLEAEWSDEAHNHPAMQRDCGGCLAAAALAAYEARRKG